MKKKTLVIGGSPNPHRYSNKAIRKLLSFKHPVVSIGKRESTVESVEIITEKVDIINVHTITMYIGPARQHEYYDYILAIKPERIIFNPGTENSELAEIATKNGIEVVENCTLVMLDHGLF